MKIRKIIGNRLIKTTISVFITAWICVLLNWPPVFAVITAIVTVEPTVSDSIKKGLIRFPASAIGSAYAVFFISLFGNSPITYTLAAGFTIATCFQFRLHAGLLVATLTAVAMIEVIHSNFLIAFFIRLGTTTIGLVVSTLVNMFILPPDYRQNIINKTMLLQRKTGKAIEQVFNSILNNKTIDSTTLTNLSKSLTRTETLIRYQKEEASYHPLASDEENQLKQYKNKIDTLRMIHYHLERVKNTPIQSISWNNEDRTIILEAIEELSSILKEEDKYVEERHHKHITLLMEIFWEDNEEMTKSSKQHITHFPPEVIILYELLSIFELITDFYEDV